MDNKNCIVCNHDCHSKVHTKKSQFNEIYTIVRCKQCKSESIKPLPSSEELAKYYERSYFTTRTDRGYDNYFSDTLKKQIVKVFTMNLMDVGFDSLEAQLSTKRRALDIGCAAGYFVELLEKRGWDSHGIDISKECTRFARESLKLKVANGDYLEHSYTEPFNLISMWATIEHLPKPQHFLAKAYDDLAEGGYLLLSTCRSDSLFKTIAGAKWRYYNVPEHIYYFTKTSLCSLLHRHNFAVKRYFTYGSGFGKGGSVKRKAADYLAKHWGLGDMIVVLAQKMEHTN